MRDTGCDQLVQPVVGAKLHRGARRQMDFPREHGNVMAVGKRDVANQPQHVAPFCAMGTALPLIAQIVLVFLHLRDGNHQRLEQR